MAAAAAAAADGGNPKKKKKKGGDHSGGGGGGFSELDRTGHGGTTVPSAAEEVKSGLEFRVSTGVKARE